jgi:hypothetical protein
MKACAISAPSPSMPMMVTYYVADTIATKLKYRLRRIGLAIGVHSAG